MLEVEVKELIIEALSLEDVSPKDIGTDMPLFGDGLGLDSIDVLALRAALRERYGIGLTGEAAESRHFASVRTLAALIEAHRRGAAGG